MWYKKGGVLQLILPFWGSGIEKYGTASNCSSKVWQISKILMISFDYKTL
jgi:hypothetical protein